MSGWFGWWKNEQAEALADAWLDAPDPDSQRAAAVELERLALARTATIPLGLFTVRTASRKSLIGMRPGSASCSQGLGWA